MFISLELLFGFVIVLEFVLNLIFVSSHQYQVMFSFLSLVLGVGLVINRLFIYLFSLLLHCWGA